MGIASAKGVIDASRLNLSWLLKLRWVAISGQAVAIGVADLGMGIELPLLLLLSILVVEIVSNIAATQWAARRLEVAEGAIAALMALDVLLLTIIIHVTGGPFNPFSSLYLVHIALAAVVLSAKYTWALSAFAFVAFGALFLLPHADHAVHHADQMRMHLRGMWVAFGTAALFIAYFVTRVRRDLADRDVELARVRAAAQHSEKLASLATLAAGAAHELASPLSTIAIASSELLAALEKRGADATVYGDVRLIRQEVERCRTILNQMALDAGQSAGEGFSQVTPRELLGDATEGMDAARLKFAVQEAAEGVALFVPRRAVSQALRAVIKNALDATPKETETSISVQSLGDHCQVVVDDRGPGMRPEILERVGEPFFTTKEPGSGMGLGVFLSRAVLERLGGALHIESTLGRGTRVRLEIPRGNLSH
jgi:two-component system sensor histidine kinase RegB